MAWIHLRASRWHWRGSGAKAPFSSRRTERLRRTATRRSWRNSVSRSARVPGRLSSAKPASSRSTARRPGRCACPATARRRPWSGCPGVAARGGDGLVGHAGGRGDQPGLGGERRHHPGQRAGVAEHAAHLDAGRQRGGRALGVESGVGRHPQPHDRLGVLVAHVEAAHVGPHPGQRQQRPHLDHRGEVVAQGPAGRSAAIHRRARPAGAGDRRGAGLRAQDQRGVPGPLEHQVQAGVADPAVGRVDHHEGHGGGGPGLDVEALGQERQQRRRVDAVGQRVRVDGDVERHGGPSLPCSSPCPGGPPAGSRRRAAGGAVRCSPPPGWWQRRWPSRPPGPTRAGPAGWSSSTATRCRWSRRRTSPRSWPAPARRWW